MESLKVAIIGAGTIGSAIASSLAGKAGKVVATRRNPLRIEYLSEKGVELLRDNEEACKEADLVIFTLKPGIIISEMRRLSPYLENKIVISFAAAIGLNLLKKASPKSHIIRAMTNMAVLVNSGYTVYSPDGDFPHEEIPLVEELFSLFGKYVRVEEKYMDALTALSGSGPAYLYLIVEALVYGGLMVGLPRELSLDAVAYTMIGAARLLLESGRHPSELKEMVVTPGGVTIEGIYQLEDNRLRTALMKAIKSATEKSKEITRELLEKNSHID
ncbi:MAG: pyrroline-5-carboxylate reductase [Synergistetes bacterium]|nr:pyrroline-5-carboxylate reductase [Synergistota bacterium]MDW8192959.1 pyrroline-5-carboxylate reductase [Synergistota bacterium]